jgi:hypothetical protein
LSSPLDSHLQLQRQPQLLAPYLQRICRGHLLEDFSPCSSSSSSTTSKREVTFPLSELEVFPAFLSA